MVRLAPGRILNEAGRRRGAGEGRGIQLVRPGGEGDGRKEVDEEMEDARDGWEEEGVLWRR